MSILKIKEPWIYLKLNVESICDTFSTEISVSENVTRALSSNLNGRNIKHGIIPNIYAFIDNALLFSVNKLAIQFN